MTTHSPWPDELASLLRGVEYHDTLHPVATDGTLAEVYEERAIQDARFGEQNHPDVNDTVRLRAREEYKTNADFWKDVNEHRVSVGTLAWDGILLEEVYEALAESDPALLRAELLQVAAVAVAWIEAIDRREQDQGSAEEQLYPSYRDPEFPGMCEAADFSGGETDVL